MVRGKQTIARTRFGNLTLAIGGALALACSPASAAKKPEPPHIYGPPPSWDAFRELAELHIRAMLVDPDSAKFRWTHGFRKGGWKPMLEGKIFGYTTCGFVNSKNRMGGYAGTAMFVVVIDNGRILYSEIDKPDGSSMTDACLKGMREGLIPGLPGGPVSSDTPAAVSSGFDFATSVVADGAYVSSVEPGGFAERAGLKPGMVITALNGLSLKGMDAATTVKLLGAVSGEANLTLVGIGSIKLRKPDIPPPRPEATSLLPAAYGGDGR